MKWNVTILVSRKPGIHHPEVVQIQKAIIEGLEIPGVSNLQMNKQFVFKLEGPTTKEEAEEIARRIGKDLLASYTLEDSSVIVIETPIPSTVQ